MTIQKNVASQRIAFLMVDATDFATPETGISVTAKYTKDGGGLSTCSNTVSEVTSGLYVITLAQTETNGDVVAYQLTGSGCADQWLIFYPEDGYANNISSILADTGTTLDNKLDSILADTGTTLENRTTSIVDQVSQILADTGTTLDNKIDSILADTGTTLENRQTSILNKVTSILTDTGTTVDNKVDSILVYVNSAIAEMSAGAPPASPTPRQALNWLYRVLRNKIETTSATQKIYDDAGTTVLASCAVSDDGTTFTKGETA